MGNDVPNKTEEDGYTLPFVAAPVTPKAKCQMSADGRG